MNPEMRTIYLEELQRQLQPAGFTARHKEGETLEIELDGHRLCRLNAAGGLGYYKKDTVGKDAALALVRDIAQSTKEYLTLIEEAPPLTADGLGEGYKLLAEFNGTVLAGHMTEYGAQFITWEWTHGRTSLWQGHYYGVGGDGGGYRAAKQDFAVRSGLLPKSALFTPEQLIKAVLSNRNTGDQVTIPFPIPEQEYDRTMELLDGLGLGDALEQNCRIDELDSWYGVLQSLKGNVDELDYLVKRLDSFCDNEAEQFQAMAHKLGLHTIKDFINLTFCCQQASVISDFSKLEQAGLDHRMNLNGGCMLTEEYKTLNGRREALQLIASGKGTVTPYGVAYDNGMELKQLYDGRHFPPYYYDVPAATLEVVSAQKGVTGFICLPVSEQQLQRQCLRAEVGAPASWLRFDMNELPEQVVNALELDHLSSDDLPALNRLCQAIKPLKEAEIKKLNAVALLAEPGDIMAVRQLAENLDQFDFIPSIRTPAEYGKYMIQESGHFEYDANLEGFYDYRLYGEQHIQEEGGQFNEYGYVAYHGTLTLGELMRDDPAEQVQREQGPQMGGLA